MGKGWTEDRRRRQAEAIRKWKPWEKSTGPRTEQGKRKCSRNAVKDPNSYDLYREAEALVCRQRDFLIHASRLMDMLDAGAGRETDY